MAAPATSSGPRDPTLSNSPSPRGSPSSPSASSGAGARRKAGKYEVVSARIPIGHERDGIAYYTVNVRTADGDKWSSVKRFSSFERLHAILVDLFGHRGFPPGADLPPKKFKFFTSHVSEHFIEERRCLLDSYLSKMLKVPEVAKSDVFLEFLASDTLASWVEPPAEGTEPGEDCEVTGVTIPQTRLMSDHVLYQVDVSNARKRKTFSKWTVLKRFGQFFELDHELRANFAGDERTLALLPASPVRQSKLLYDHMDPHFIEHRRVLLENYLHKLLLMPIIAKNAAFLTFLGVQM
jgi:hypothetical protein